MQFLRIFQIFIFICGILFSQSIFAALTTAKSFDPAASLKLNALNEKSFSGLKSLIKNEDIQTIEQLIPHLPYEMRRNYTLMYKSLSTQGSSFENPRAILFGQDAKLILTFNGSPEQRGFDRVEVMDYDPEDSIYNFHEITFRSSQKPIYSETNPKKCLECHSSHPKPNGLRKPIWRRYEKWIGAYGSIADMVSANPTDERIKAKDKTTIKNEYRMFQDYLANANDHDRYKYLIRPEGSATSPYQTNFRGHYQFRPNLRLLELLMFRQAKTVSSRIAKNVAKTPAKILPLATLLYLDDKELFDKSCFDVGSFAEGQKLFKHLLGFDLDAVHLDFTEGEFIRAHLYKASKSGIYRSVFSAMAMDILKSDPETHQAWTPYMDQFTEKRFYDLIMEHRDNEDRENEKLGRPKEMRIEWAPHVEVMNNMVKFMVPNFSKRFSCEDLPSTIKKEKSIVQSQMEPAPSLPQLSPGANIGQPMCPLP